MDNGVTRHGENQRDTGMVALNTAGRIDAELLEHQKEVTRKENGRTVVIKKGVSGMGTERMLRWSVGFVDRHPGDHVLRMDPIGCHRNKEMIATLETGGVYPFFIPPQASKYISPCENSFFSSMKARMRNMSTGMTKEKKAAFEMLCAEYPQEMVRHYFHHCGWHWQTRTTTFALATF
jgi:hypothetical protein